MAKLNYQYGAVFWTDLHPGDIIPTGDGSYMSVTQDMIDSDGTLKQSVYVSNKILDSNYPPAVSGSVSESIYEEEK